MKASFRENDILILIGAGCSKEAGIPTSIDMVKEIEKLVLTRNEWQEFKELYFFVKSSILYSDGLKGKSNQTIDIERLVNTLYELEKKDEHPIYPFIGSWNPKLIELCGYDFKKIKDFKNKILEQLKHWVTLDDYSRADYYKKFFSFQESLGMPLRIFSLNYDLCLEKNKPSENYYLERGFGDDRIWEWQRFERNPDIAVNIYLYKMHGSIDWVRDENGRLKYSDEITRINPDLIFGSSYKLQYMDPYLFFAYEFRKYCLEAKIIVTIGYGFGDEHINGIISQALKNKQEIKLLIDTYREGVSEENIKKEIVAKLNITSDKILIKNKKASEFLKEDLNVEKISELLPQKTIFDNEKK